MYCANTQGESAKAHDNLRWKPQNRDWLKGNGPTKPVGGLFSGLVSNVSRGNWGERD